MKLRIPYWYLLIVPMACYVVGFILNTVTVAVNHGLMPVLTSYCQEYQNYWAQTGDSIHACMAPSSHLKFFSDWIRFSGRTASIGDLFIWVYSDLGLSSLYIWIALIIKDNNRGKR